MLKPVGELTKPGIVILVLLCALLGYALGFTVEPGFELLNLILLLAGITLLSAGSLALNQTQEWSVDAKMPRTQRRPIPSGRLTPRQGFVFGFSFLILGLTLLYMIRPLTAELGLLTVLLYNLLYTMYWKRKWAFAAVPGAIPGAMPVVIGFSASNPDILSRPCLYAFLIMFLWQMPHFWSLAIKFADDYRIGGFPVLPVRIGVPKTLFHIGLYVFAYVGLALVSPFFVEARYVYLVLVIPFGFKVMWEFFKYYKTGGEKGWLSFFLWVNFSMLAFLLAPVIDKFSLLIEHL